MRIPSFNGLVGALVTIVLMLALCLVVYWGAGTVGLVTGPWITGAAAALLLVVALVAGWRRARRQSGASVAEASQSLLRSLALALLMLLGCFGLLVLAGSVFFN